MANKPESPSGPRPFNHGQRLDLCCKRGHLRTEHNTYVNPNHPERGRRCQLCAEIARMRWDRKAKVGARASNHGVTLEFCCKRGHPRTKSNTYDFPDRDTHGKRRRCKICRAMMDRAAYQLAKQRAAVVPVELGYWSWHV